MVADQIDKHAKQIRDLKQALEDLKVYVSPIYQVLTMCHSLIHIYKVWSAQSTCCLKAYLLQAVCGCSTDFFGA